ncbi:MAG: hypothetical protein ACK4QW_19705, partial [Alphaproteobacteria bacterium]
AGTLALCGMVHTLLKEVGEVVAREEEGRRLLAARQAEPELEAAGSTVLYCDVRVRAPARPCSFAVRPLASGITRHLAPQVPQCKDELANTYVVSLHNLALLRSGATAVPATAAAAAPMRQMAGLLTAAAGMDLGKRKRDAAARPVALPVAFCCQCAHRFAGDEEVRMHDSA